MSETRFDLRLSRRLADDVDQVSRTHLWSWPLTSWAQCCGLRSALSGAINR